jgi:hypothetical protein
LAIRLLIYADFTENLEQAENRLGEDYNWSPLPPGPVVSLTVCVCVCV